uniref:Odorant receptor n=1 Tax=Apolygus lucorum TaxID=248454 RepID=A0A1Q1NIT3_APOLU|nr:olfactory receptor [Apolygus lucorum]
MAKLFGFHIINADSRKCLSYRMSFPMTTLLMAFNLCMLSGNAIGCLIAALLDSNFDRRLMNVKGMMLLIMIILLAINESFISRNRVNRILDYINRIKSITRYGFKEEEDIMNKAIDDCYKSTKYSTTFFFTNSMLMVTLPPTMAIITGESWKQLPYPWVITQTNDWLYYSSLVLQVVATALCHGVGAAGFSLLTTMKPLAAAFDKVILGINRIEERAARKMSEEGITYQESMLSCLKESIAHHQEIVDELLMEKPHLEIMFFAQVTFISIVMACEAYPIIMGIVDVSGLIRGVLFLFIQVMCCGFLNLEFDTIANKNVEVSEALYGTPWYALGVEYRHVVLNSMTFSQNPIWICGMGFFGLRASRATFYSAMVSACNMLNMFRKFA